MRSTALSHGASSAASRASPISPPRANSTTSTSSGPKITFQCSVMPDSHSSVSRKAAAPMIAPLSVPMPPRITMMSSSPERCHDM